MTGLEICKSALTIFKGRIQYPSQFITKMSLSQNVIFVSFTFKLICSCCFINSLPANIQNS